MLGRQLHLRFSGTSGNAMGMNMISKATQSIYEDILITNFPKLRLLTLSGNTCTDKKASAMNWIRHRGYEVQVEAVIPNKLFKEH